MRPDTPQTDNFMANILTFRDGAKMIAKASRAHFEAFRDEGFAPSEALTLVVALLQNPSRPKK